MRRTSRTSQKRAATTTVTVPTLTENHAKEGLELRFPDKPAADVLDRIKAAGWHWSRFSGCWYIHRSESARKFAEGLLGPLATPAAVGTPYPGNCRG